MHHSSWRQMGHIMDNALAQEALKCRQRAEEYVGRAEEAFLLKLASTFDELAHSSDLLIVHSTSDGHHSTRPRQPLS